MPGPFTFQPTQPVLECSAFGVAFKSVALGVITLILVWGAMIWQESRLSVSPDSGGWYLAAAAMLVYTEWHIFRSKTRLDNQALLQTWIWQKKVEIAELAYAKVVRVHGFEWLVAPRLYTRTLTNRLTVFYASSEAMLQEFHRLERELKQARTF